MLRIDAGPSSQITSTGVNSVATSKLHITQNISWIKQVSIERNTPGSSRARAVVRTKGKKKFKPVHNPDFGTSAAEQETFRRQGMDISFNLLRMMKNHKETLQGVTCMRAETELGITKENFSILISKLAEYGLVEKCLMRPGYFITGLGRTAMSTFELQPRKYLTNNDVAYLITRKIKAHEWQTPKQIAQCGKFPPSFVDEEIYQLRSRRILITKRNKLYVTTYGSELLDAIHSTRYLSQNSQTRIRPGEPVAVQQASPLKPSDSGLPPDKVVQQFFAAAAYNSPVRR